MTRLPGSGGACDIASLAQRFVVLLEHSKERLPERVSYVTSPGNGDGRGWRQRVGLPRGGPAAVITSKAVLRFGDDGEAYLSSTHPGVEVEEVLRNTGWRLRVADEVRTTTRRQARKSSRRSANTTKTASGPSRNMARGKLMTMRDAVAELVPDGSSVALGLQMEQMIPFAAGHEIIRQKKRGLTLIGPISDILFDQMIAAGCVERVIAAWVGNVMMGSAYNFRRGGGAG